MPFDEDLDKQQQAAVEAKERAIAVLAGPGSGKTRVLSYRTRHLLTADKSANALLLTFTNKAAAEMKARAIAVTPAMSRRILAVTFHSFGMNVLRAHGTHVGLTGDFDVLDEIEQRDTAERASLRAGSANLAQKYSTQRLRKQLATADVLRFSEFYEKLKREDGVADFDDLVVCVAQLFERNPQIAQAYGTKYQHILVDEFQDTNNAQFAVVRALAEYAKTISVFADDDQAIFGFAGAETRNIGRFCEDLQAKEYPLTTNYRCREEIVECANRLIEANRSKGRRMRAKKNNGVVSVGVFPNAASEAIAICDDIQSRLNAGLKAHQISVLTRRASRLEQLRDVLVERGIPHSNWLGASYNSREQRIVRTCLAVIRPVLNQRSCRALCDMLGVTDGGVRRTDEFLKTHRACPGVNELAEISRIAQGRAKVTEIVQSVSAAVAIIDPDLDIDGLVAEAAAFEKHDPEYSLDHFLGDLALGGKSGAPTEGGGVKLATFHRTKGLQWPQVYLIGLEDDTLPDYRCTTDDAIKDERRLCFVGVCRAEDSLTITRVRESNGYGKEPSRFLREMGVGENNA